MLEIVAMSAAIPSNFKIRHCRVFSVSFVCGFVSAHGHRNTPNKNLRQEAEVDKLEIPSKEHAIDTVRLSREMLLNSRILTPRIFVAT